MVFNDNVYIYSADNQSIRIHLIRVLNSTKMRTFTLLLSMFVFSCSVGQNDPSNILKETIPDLQKSSLEHSSFRKDSITNLLNLINETPHKDLRGLVVIEKNKIVIEEGYNTFWRKSINDIRSAGKSITSMLLGVAIQEGLVANLEQDVHSFFTKNKNSSVNEGYKSITLRHLLDMSSGLDADTNNSQTTGHAANWIAKDDWKEYLLSVPLTGKPGEKWVYADINALLIGSIIEETSGLSLKDFAKEKLFDPLEIEQFYWYTNAANQTGAAGNLFLSTVDFAKLGLLISNRGKWGNTQIIDPDYIKRISDRTFDLSDEFGMETYYGMMWYKSTKTFRGKSINYVYASGMGGNHLVVIPDREIVIAITSGAYGAPYGHGRSYAIWDKIMESFK